MDENLREVALDPEGLLQYIHEFEKATDRIRDPKERATALGEIAVWLRIAGRFEKAEDAIRQSMDLIQAYKLGVALETQQKIRWAHILQWKGSFDKSNAVFLETIHTCRLRHEAARYLDFALQHSGKNDFDQKKIRRSPSEISRGFNSTQGSRRKS